MPKQRKEWKTTGEAAALAADGRKISLKAEPPSAKGK